MRKGGEVCVRDTEKQRMNERTSVRETTNVREKENGGSVREYE